MRVLLIVTLCNLLNVIVAQFDIINEDLGDFHFQAAVGNLPLKYPLSEQDQKASDKAADIIDFIQLVPKIDPLNIPAVKPLGIDVPFLWLSGKVYLENLVVTGVKQFELHGLELRLINFRSDLNITIPQLYFEGGPVTDINVDNIELRGIGYKVHSTSIEKGGSSDQIDAGVVSGGANLFDVGVVVVSGGYKTQAPVGEVLQIDSAAVKVDIRNVVFNLTNMVMGEELIEDYEDKDSPPATQLFNRSSSSSASDGNMLNGLLQKVLDMANKELFKVSIDFFLEYLLSDTY